MHGYKMVIDDIETKETKEEFMMVGVVMIES